MLSVVVINKNIHSRRESTAISSIQRRAHARGKFYNEKKEEGRGEKKLFYNFPFHFDYKRL
jgi:hypothetical protein